MSIKRISAEELHSLMNKSTPPKVIDVRDSDHIGGHIKKSEHVPSQSFPDAVNGLRERLKDESAVVFHCQLSQQRGPSCAAAYKRAAPADQQVFVLDGGFQEWANAYGKDPNLTEDFKPDLY